MQLPSHPFAMLRAMSPLSRASRPTRCGGLVAAAAAGLLIAGAPTTAAASTMTISAPAQTVESTSVPITVSATLDVASYVEVKIRTAGAPCAATAAEDPGSPLLDRSAIESSFAATANRSFDAAGLYVICGWARDTTQASSPVVASAVASVDVRIPKLSLSLTVPSAVAVDDLFTITAVAQAEVERLAYAGIVPDLGKGCPASYGALQKTTGSVPVLSQTGFVVSGGPLTTKELISLPKAGKYLACGYFHHGAVSAAPQATAKVAFVAAPPCVVPSLAGKTLAQAKKALTKAHCRLGKAKKAKSKSVKKSRIIRTGKKAGTVLAPNTAIGVVVSKGR